MAVQRVVTERTSSLCVVVHFRLRAAETAPLPAARGPSSTPATRHPPLGTRHSPPWPRASLRFNFERTLKLPPLLTKEARREALEQSRALREEELCRCGARP
eukprot:scaffold7081_cov225-Pinguiococcus_pyrenoidosus.AAC.1